MAALAEGPAVRRRRTPQDIIEALAEHHTPEVMILIVAPVTMLLGILVAAFPDTLEAETTFDTALIVPPTVWAGAWIVGGLWLLLAGVHRRRAAIAPALLLAGIFAMWGIGIAVEAYQGIPYILVMPIFASLVCTATASFCTARRGEIR